MVTARDLMKINIPTLNFDMTVPQAIKFMSESISHFAVVEADSSRMNGVITEAALMKIYLRYQTQPEKETLILYRDLFDPIQLVLESEDFTQVVKKIMVSVGNRVIVVNADGKATGYITPKDILPYFNDDLKSLKGGVVIPKLNSDIEALKSDLYMYETFFTKSPFLMHSVNLQGNIQMANESMHAVLGYNYGDLIGKSVYDIYPQTNHEKVSSALKSVTDKAYQKIVKGQMVRADKKNIEVEMMTRALCNEKGESIGTITVSRPFDMEYFLSCLPNH